MNKQPEDKDTNEQEIELALLKTLKDEPQSLNIEKSDEQIVFLLPLLRRPFFPGMVSPILIEPGPFLDMIKDVAKTKHKTVALFLTKNENIDPYTAKVKDFYKTGVLARILRIVPQEQGGVQVIFNIEKRIKIKRSLKHPRHLKVRTESLPISYEMTDELKAYSVGIISTIKELLNHNPLFKEEFQIFLSHSDFTEPGRLADFGVALTTATREELQDILETLDIPKRIEKALIILKKEEALSRLQLNISEKIDSTIAKGQREFYLKEQLKAIRKELGLDKDDRQVDREKFEARIKERAIPENVLDVIEEEIEKLSALEPQSAEYAISRGYLDWLTIIPWGTYSEERHNLKEASKVLNEDHYGLDDIKERILEFISVGKLTGGVRGSIICLVGPPGVGKTSIGKSIARALNREFYRFSVGGMRDEAEIKGHRRTYIGAMPGRLIQALKTTKTMNPVIMLDEVDKIGSSYQGDPASALLEVLDPEQNNAFLDHFLDVPCDLSDVLFIVTANLLDTIPEALVDRMDIMRLSGYIMEEKLEIAQKYLIPRNRKEMGLKASQITFTKEGLRAIINGYAREAGVRNLENLIKKILRKTARNIVENQGRRGRKKLDLDKKISINKNNIDTYLGNPIFTSDRLYEENPVGVATGLAWTALGGVTLYIEAIRVSSEKTSMKLTGQAGSVMKESFEIAWTYLHSAIEKYVPKNDFFKNFQVHLHIPEGATPKDGPSAGITMVCALISLLLNEPILNDLGMTGEITLTGRVLPIGGVKEKLVASKRAGLKKVIFPKDNQRDVKELPKYIKEGLDLYFVDHFDEVFKIAFPGYRLYRGKS